MELSGRREVWKQLPWDSDTIGDALAAATIEALEESPGTVDAYDAILVDEGQDFRPSWWSALRKSLRPDGEMLLVADRAQDIYGRNELWTESAMDGAGFRGPWATLDISYRMPGSLVDLTAQFVRRFFDDSDIAAPLADGQQRLALDRTVLRWVQTNEERLLDACMEAIRSSLAAGRENGQPSPSFADVVFLCDRKATGRAVVNRLEEKGVKAIHTFSDDDQTERRQKLFFFKGDARVKATTIHSFKGWEGRHLVVAAAGSGGGSALHTVYTALTRLKAHSQGSRLTVVTCLPELEPFGRTWPDFSLSR
jgi:hypothetical protein